jgi:oxalate decarboxylase/phosphoglucose isomerase-like protein (cupin superfamily)
MLTEKEMDAIAEKYILEESNGTNYELILIKKSEVKKEYGKIYYYNTKKFIETREFEYALLGNAPFLVEKATGKIIVFGTSQPKEYYIKEYEEGRLS